MIYFIQPENGGPIKIGFTKHPKKRLTTHQMSNHEKLILRCVMDGDELFEQEIHEKFKHLRKHGEWFNPGDDLCEFMMMLPQINERSETRRAENHQFWKGDDVTKGWKRIRMAKQVPLEGECELCDKKATDRKLRDKSPDNFSIDNIILLCKSCAIRHDGRMEKLIEHASQLRKTQPPKPCINCNRLAKPLARGRCSACYSYFKRHEVERPVAILQERGISRLPRYVSKGNNKGDCVNADEKRTECGADYQEGGD